MNKKNKTVEIPNDNNGQNKHARKKIFEGKRKRKRKKGISICWWPSIDCFIVDIELTFLKYWTATMGKNIHLTQFYARMHFEILFRKKFVEN